MIIYCAADPLYFKHYFDLWANQLNKFYPNHYKLIALYKPTKETFSKCKDYNVNSVDVTDLFPQNPTKNHFYLLRWLALPYYKNTNILATQVNCLAVKTQNLPENLDVDIWRISRIKRGNLGGISASIFTSQAAEKVVMQARTMLNNPPETDHEMTMWQMDNLKQHQEKSEHQIKVENKDNLPDYTCWITARTANVWTHEQKLKALRANI